MLQELPGHRARLEQAFDSDDPAAVSRAAHALRGAAGNLGAVDLQARATSIEQACREDDLAMAVHEHPHLLAELARLEIALDRMVLEDEPS